VISRVGFTDETLLGLEDGPLIGGTVTKDGNTVGTNEGVSWNVQQLELRRKHKKPQRKYVSFIKV